MPGDLPPPDPSQRNQYEPERPYSSEPASYDRLRRVLIAVGGVAMVVFAIGLGLLVLRDTGDETRPAGFAGTAPPDVASPTEAPATSAAPAGTTATTAAASAASTTAATTAASTAASTAATTAATTAPATTLAPSTSTTAAPAVTPAPDPSVRAVATAQALLDAFADGRWSEARALNPGRNESDAFLQNAYGPIVDATVVPAAVTPLGPGRYDLRFGIVSHETQPSGQQTVLMCSHWRVDVASKTIDRLASARLRVEGGFVDPSTRAGELSSVCTKVP